MHLSYFHNESYISQLFTRKFSPRQPKCLNGVVVGDWDGPFQNESYIYQSLLNYSENGPNWGYITIMLSFFCFQVHTSALINSNYCEILISWPIELEVSSSKTIQDLDDSIKSLICCNMMSQ